MGTNCCLSTANSISTFIAKEMWHLLRRLFKLSHCCNRRIEETNPHLRYRPVFMRAFVVNYCFRCAGPSSRLNNAFCFVRPAHTRHFTSLTCYCSQGNTNTYKSRFFNYARHRKWLLYKQKKQKTSCAHSRSQNGRTYMEGDLSDVCFD